jgi:hypothetical protein
MINALVNKVATSLVTLNSDWLTEIRTVGYLTKISDSDYVTTDGLQGIGLTDTKGNSGYIRFSNDINFRIQEMPESQRRSSCSVLGQTIALDLTLVLLINSPVPEDVVFGLIVQMNTITFTEDPYKGRNVKIRASSGSSNSVYTTNKETGKQQASNELRAVSIDFRVMFDWMQNCDNTNIRITMDNCISDDFVDYGCIQLCENLTMEQDATYTGNMTMRTAMNGVTIIRTFEVETGEDIELPTETLTAGYSYIIQLFDEDGEMIEIQSNDPTPSLHESIKLQVNP